MNRFTRMLTITGLGLVAGATIGAGPAMAASSAGQGSARSESTATTQSRSDRVVDTYSSYNKCDWAGERGEDRGWWDDYDCFRVRDHHGHRAYALVVEEDNWGHGFHGHWSRPWWPGHGFPGGPGGNGPFFPGGGGPHFPHFPGNNGPHFPFPGLPHTGPTIPTPPAPPASIS
jgi:hypothetical protein